jgi:hypothetical protein
MMNKISNDEGRRERKRERIKHPPTAPMWAIDPSHSSYQK